MKCVVPLAGPDLEHPDYGFRPLVPHEGIPLLRRAIESRPWRSRLATSDYLFVVRNVPRIGELAAWLTSCWLGAQVLLLPTMTGGALFSALAGAAALAMDEEEALMIDLADILFDGPADIFDRLESGAAGAVVPCFYSDETCYSYLREENGVVVEAAEKRVIAQKASAGVYGFAGRPLFVAAAAHSMLNRERLAYRGNLFVCPMVNGVIALGANVEAPLVEGVEPVSKMFHLR